MAAYPGGTTVRETIPDPTDAANADARSLTRGNRRRVPRVETAVAMAVIVAVAATTVIVAVVVGVTAPVLVTPGASPVALGAPHFVEEAAAAGISHAYDGEFTYFVGGGVAAFDCDDDRKPDLLFAGGGNPAALFRNRSPIGGAMEFQRVPDPATDLTAVTGAYPLDIDGDGRTDLAVLRLGENVILRGLGDCRFERANETLGVAGGDGWTVGFSAAWESPSVALPTLAFGDYVVLDDDLHATAECADNTLVRPAADNLVYADPVSLSPGWCTLSMLFSDWDRSGRRDLRVTNDRHYYRDGEEQLWRIDQGEAPRVYTREDGWARLQVWGMGIASRDVTGDGYPEIYLTSQGDNKLQTLIDGATQPRYGDIALRRGATAHRPYAGGDVLPSTAWHPEFEDINNDGFVDLFVSKGNVEAETEHAMIDPSNLLIGQADGTFMEGAEAAGMVDFSSARGAALVDLNLDGLLDLVKVVRRENVEVWRNVGSGTAANPSPMGAWMAVELEQRGANHDAIGAWVEVRVGDRTSERELTVGGGHASGQLGWIHAGLGSAERAEVRVTWPDGEVGPWLPVRANQFARIVRGASEVQSWTP